MPMRRLAMVTAAVTLMAPLLGATAQAAPAQEGLQLVAVHDSLLATHYWYVQTYAGHKVLDSYYAKHVDKATGQVTVDDGRQTVSGLTVSATPNVPAAKAEASAGESTHAPAYANDVAVLPGTQAKLVYTVLSDSGKGTVRTIVDAGSGAVLKSENMVKEVNGTGKVFSPNPVASLQNESLTDQNDADSAVPASAYKSVTLTDLDGSGRLSGKYAKITNSSSQQPQSSTNTFNFTRHNKFFEPVMAYYSVTETQKYIHSLGFTNVNSEAQKLKTTGLTDDNSFYDPSVDQITFGTGGVDDAEDSEVIWHEYGHAIQDAQVPGFGSSTEAGSIGEGFGDWWAMQMSSVVQPDSATTPWACLMDWDSTSYTTGTPHCIRRTDTNLTYADRDGEVHDDGQIWSRALFDIFRAFGRDKSVKLVLESQFSYSPSTSMAAAARATVNTAQKLFGATDAATVTAAFHARGII
ncbi:M36 family metallopeptidase [Actinocrispum wychmicini]|uniref:Zn-dependent metalloprotease n=1 Tax=Actinocrispum wychmicini TaxID=1213861 RepID=A0A4R2JZ71_9PSEU|nr:M36 family metallopeptidase [Actinocrispum wychmicini]TCO62726.1 Zn-dependent metalloprotease [Actinocrispum wychmicini]